MTIEQTAQQLELAAQILRTGHPFEVRHDASDKWHASLGVNPAQAVLQNWCLRLVLATPPDNRPLHNPDNLTAEQVGVGYRLTVEGEPPHEDAKVWLSYYGKWCDRESTGPYIKHHVYRLPLSVPWPEPADPYAELKAAHAAGKVVQVIDCGMWLDLPTPNWCDPVGRYRIKPTESAKPDAPAFTLPPPPPGVRWHREDGWTADDLPQGYRPCVVDEREAISGYMESMPDRNSGLGWVSATYHSSGLDFYSFHHRTTRPLTFNHAGKTWTYHRPGDPMPCDGGRKAYIMYQDQQTAFMATAATAGWARNENRPSDIIGWRYADEKKTVKFGPEDVLPGSSFRPKHWGTTGHERIEVVQVCTTDVRLGTNRSYDFEELEASWLINRSIPLTGKWNPDAWELCSKQIPA